MRYQQPYGVSDPNAPYVNGNPATGQQGSIPPAAAFEHHQRELVGLINASGFTPDETDLTQVLRSIRRQYINYCIDSGVANSLVVTLSPPLLQYQAGLPLRVLVAVTNTGATVINANGLGTRAIKRTDGSDLHPGDIVAGMIANIVDNGTFFQLQNPIAGTATTSNTYTIKIPYIADSSSTVNSIVALFAPAITAVTEGDFISVKIANTNTGPMTITVNSLAPLPIKRDDGADLQAGDCLALEQILLENHGTYWQHYGLTRSQVLPPSAPLKKLFVTGYGQNIPNASLTQLTCLTTIVQNTLGTSAWDGRQLTIGAGEDGLWAVSLGMQLGGPLNFVFNGVSQPLGAYPGGNLSLNWTMLYQYRSAALYNTFFLGENTSGAQSVGQSFLLDLLVGDKIDFHTQINFSGIAQWPIQPGTYAMIYRIEGLH